MTAPVLDHILGQITAARSDLEAVAPTAINWSDRAIDSATRLVPWLTANAVALGDHVQDVLNAHHELSSLWVEIRPAVDPQRTVAFDRFLALDAELRQDVTGELVSRIVVEEMCRREPTLRANGKSDYPDIYRADLDYTAVPAFRRTRRSDAETVTYGAARKGSAGRPVRVPDGLEVKTCRRSIRVDCHHPHIGLYLIFVYDRPGPLYVVRDLQIAFLRPADFTESRRNTTATTVKYSFNGDRFVSLLGS